jgi:hypothetical protein
MNKIVIIAISLTFLVASFANAALVDNGDGTVTQTRNGGSTLMWLQDANYAMTSGYDADGKMFWADAVIWINSLNSSNYLGYNDWRLPETFPVNGTSYNYTTSYDGSTDRGFNISAPGSAYPGSTGSEMAYMFYTELGNLGYYDLNGNYPQSGYGLQNTGLFNNLQTGVYWSGTESTKNPGYNFGFFQDRGQQIDALSREQGLYSWAVRDVAVVPEPISSTLFIVGGATLGFRRFRKKLKK